MIKTIFIYCNQPKNWDSDNKWGFHQANLRVLSSKKMEIFCHISPTKEFGFRQTWGFNQPQNSDLNTKHYDDNRHTRGIPDKIQSDLTVILSVCSCWLVGVPIWDRMGW